MQKMWSLVLLVGMLTIALASPTSAINCRDWSQFYSSSDRRAAIEDQVWTILESGQASGWNVNRNQIGRCVVRRLGPIELDIEDLCAEGQSTSMQAVNELIMNYIRSCVY